MNPILYSSAEREFKNNGIGVLIDASKCEISQTRNGKYELKMEYPANGSFAGELAIQRIILAKPDSISRPQPFRIYAISKKISGALTVYARHIAYDLMGIPVQPFTASGATDAMTKLTQYAAVDCPFSFSTDKTIDSPLTVTTPIAIWDLLKGTEGGILDVYGGEYEFDRYSVTLHKSRGKETGETIRYGKNLMNFEQEESCANVYTGVYPFWADEDENILVQLPNLIINANGTYSHTRILALDLSDEWEEQPTAEQLRDRATKYMQSNQIGVPDVSLSLEIAQLEQTVEYRGTGIVEPIGLCDTLRVEFPLMNVSTTAKCVGTTYDCLRERYKKIQVGSVKTDITTVLLDQYTDITTKASTAKLNGVKKRIDNLTPSDIGAVTKSELDAASKALGVTGAVVGQIPVVAAVDSNGTPTAWTMINAT